MKTLILIIGMLPPVIADGSEAKGMNSLSWYALGALIALFLLAYLVYSLVKPEKF
ncbi:MAG TPA: K(+)-transporting ATPase subunit F [Prolixibacteraceae bacterium]|nr:K(+)-transporting ATPase subunit F [Prolixibacteraceae bacterium]